MTPSINLLAESALELGNYYIDCEFELVEDEFVNAGESVDTLEKFKEWVQGYQYYHCLVCICAGNKTAIDSELEANYDELLELSGADIVTAA